MALPPQNAAKTHCEHGHPFSGDNLGVMTRRDGRRERYCRTCANRRVREHFRRTYVPHPRPRKPPPEPKQRKRESAAVRALRRLVQGDGCWEWSGATSNGYGVIQLGRGLGTSKVHRVIYEHFRGPIPPGLDVMHSCHNRLCANPDHLEVGTRAENMRQSQRAGRLKRSHRRSSAPSE